MQRIAAAGRVITILLAIQFAYLVTALCIIPAKQYQHQTFLRQHDIVELQEVVQNDDGFGYTAHLIKRPLIPEDTTTTAVVPHVILLKAIVFYCYSHWHLRETQRRIHAPPFHI